MCVLLTKCLYAAGAPVSEDLEKHMSQVNLSLEGADIIKNLGVSALTDMLYVEDSDLEREGMTLVDQRKAAQLREAARLHPLCDQTPGTA